MTAGLVLLVSITAAIAQPTSVPDVHADVGVRLGEPTRPTAPSSSPRTTSGGFGTCSTSGRATRWIGLSRDSASKVT